jgi:hypothetical protein
MPRPPKRRKRITEDDPRWDASRMGNKVSGPGYKGRKGWRYKGRSVTQPTAKTALAGHYVGGRIKAGGQVKGHNREGKVAATQVPAAERAGALRVLARKRLRVKRGKGARGVRY